MWPFKSKPEEVKPKPRKLMIPEGRIEETLATWDTFNESKRRLDRYRFWKLTEELFPETAKGSWGFRDSNATTPYLLEILKND